MDEQDKKNFLKVIGLGSVGAAVGAKDIQTNKKDQFWMGTQTANVKYSRRSFLSAVCPPQSKVT